MDAIIDDLRSLEETARFFGVSVPTVRSWIADGCPVRQRGSPGVPYAVALRDIHEWRQRRAGEEIERNRLKAEHDAQLKLDLLGDQALTAGDAISLSIRQRSEALRAELDRTKLAQLRRELMRADDAKLVVVEAVGLLRQKVRQMPDLVAPEFGLTDRQVERMLAIIDDALDEAADSLARLAEDALAAA